MVLMDVVSIILHDKLGRDRAKGSERSFSPDSSLDSFEKLDYYTKSLLSKHHSSSNHSAKPYKDDGCGYHVLLGEIHWRGPCYSGTEAKV